VRTAQALLHAAPVPALKCDVTLSTSSRSAAAAPQHLLLQLVELLLLYWIRASLDRPFGSQTRLKLPSCLQVSICEQNSGHCRERVITERCKLCQLQEQLIAGQTAAQRHSKGLMWMGVLLYLLHHFASLDIQLRAVTGC
jgi:hypothetical protein